MSYRKTPIKRAISSLFIFCIGAFLSITLWNINQPETIKNKIYYRADQAPSLNTGILLGASVKASGEPSHMLYERIEAAAALYRAKKIQKVLISGDSSPYYDEVKIMKKTLIESGVMPDDLITDRLGVRTFDSLYRAKNVYDLDRAYIISQSYHLPRALYLARHFDIDALGFSANEEGKDPASRHMVREYLARYLMFLDIFILNTRSSLEISPDIDQVEENADQKKSPETPEIVIHKPKNLP